MSLKRANRRLTGIGGASQRAVAVTTGVQHLQHDVAAVGVHEVSNAAVIVRHALRRHHRTGRSQPTLDVGSITAGDDEPHATFGAPTQVGSQLGDITGAIFQAGVH